MCMSYPMISTWCANALKSVSGQNIEQEARLGSFHQGDFLPGVSKQYFDAIETVLTKYTKSNQTKSIAIYFDQGLRAEQFQHGHLEIIRKRKIADDIDIDEKDHYSMRISTSEEVPVKSNALEHEIKRFMKTKSLPKLFKEGTLMSLKPNSTVYYHGKPHNSNTFFGSLTWKNAHPVSVNTLDRNKRTLSSCEHQYLPHTMVDIICLAGQSKQKPVFTGQYTIQARLDSLCPLTCYANVNPVPPYIPTAWRLKERSSFTLWPGMSIDLTKTTFSKFSIQHCFDGRGTVRYEVEADWNTKTKDTTEFEKVITHILYSKS